MEHDFELDSTLPENPHEMLRTPMEYIAESQIKIQEIREEIEDIEKQVDEQRDIIASLVMGDDIDRDDPDAIHEIRAMQGDIMKLNSQVFELLSTQKALEEKTQKFKSVIEELSSKIPPERNN